MLLTGLPFRETPAGSGQARRPFAPSLDAIKYRSALGNRCLGVREAGIDPHSPGETMNFAYWMLIAAAMLPYLTIALAKSAGAIDNRAPRPSLESLSGWRQRAVVPAMYAMPPTTTRQFGRRK